MFTNTHCSTCGTATGNGDHATEKECIAALRTTIDQILTRVKDLEHEIARKEKRDWVLRDVLAYPGKFKLEPELAARLVDWISRESDPALLTKVLKAGNREVSELATRHAPREAWTEENLELAARRHLAILAERHLLPDHWITDEKLSEYVVVLPTTYRRGKYERGGAGRVIEALARSGYKIPEKLRKEIARAAGPKSNNEIFMERIAIMRGALAIPELSTRNLSVIAREITEAYVGKKGEYRPSAEPIYAAILAHPACTQDLAITLAMEGLVSNLFIHRALAASEKWGNVKEVRAFLVSSDDVRVLWSLCKNPNTTREEFVELLTRAIKKDPEYILGCLEECKPVQLVPDDLLPLLKSRKRGIRLKAIAIIGDIERARFSTGKLALEPQVQGARETALRETVPHKT